LVVASGGRENTPAVMPASTVSAVAAIGECMAVATMTRLDDTPEDKAETVGLALPQIEVKVTDPVSSEVVPPGTLGELCIRGFR
jgi:acyl-CoA synthetase (AMP-forming)/AMP-acid ligase II